LTLFGWRIQPESASHNSIFLSREISQLFSQTVFSSHAKSASQPASQPAEQAPYVFRVNGQIHHHIGSLLSEPNKIPKFAELYIFDTKNEIENRLRALTKEEPDRHDLNPAIIKGLQEMLDQHNPLVKIFRHAHDLFEEHKGIDISIRILGANKGDPIQYEMPYSEDLAMLIVGDITAENYKRDIIVSTKKKGSAAYIDISSCIFAITISIIIPIR